MVTVFASPSRYVQGKGVLFDGVAHIRALGTQPLLLCDDVVWRIVGERFEKHLTQSGLAVTHVPFQGESSFAEVERVRAIGRQEGNDVVLALGGGKTLDAGKAIADQLGVPIAILPTIASTDAPTSALSVMYTEEGVFEKYVFYKKNPELVLVDTAVIAQAPPRLLASGIADALATWVEMRAVLQKNGQTMAGGQPSLAATAIGQKCEEVLFANARQAFYASQRHVVTPALEAVVEANTLLSGIGFESGGLAAAHAIHNGFTALHGDIHQLTHGEKVAYGTLTQLFLENRPTAELDRYIDLYQDLGLPTTLAELHLSSEDTDALLQVGRQATVAGETIHQMPFAVHAEDVAAALQAVDAYVTAR